VKLLQVILYFEYAEEVESILDRNQVVNYVRHSMIEGKDKYGKRRGTQVFPGRFSVIHAQVEEEQLASIFSDLSEFKKLKKAHEHLQALVLPIEKIL